MTTLHPIPPTSSTMSIDLGHANVSGTLVIGPSPATQDQGCSAAYEKTPAPTFRHLMVDIETSAKHTSRSLVLSVGLLPYRLLRSGPQFGRPTLILPHLASQILDCRMVDPETQKWWRDKCSAKASAHWADPSWSPAWDGRVEYVRLSDVGAIISDVARQQLVPDYEIWAKGSVFDLGNLENGFVGVDGKTPYDFRGVRDHRTWIVKAPKQRERPADVKAKTTHDPIDDCVNQVWTLWEHALIDWFEDAADLGAKAA